MISPTSRMIPVETEITEEQFNDIDNVIEHRKCELRKLGRGDIELSIWLMEQLNHIKLIKEFNAPRFHSVELEEREA